MKKSEFDGIFLMYLYTVIGEKSLFSEFLVNPGELK
jgi:hypothetical protein